jgi:Arc/MetJ family transcription regulator
MMVEIDDELLEAAKKLSRAQTKRQTIELALRELVKRLHYQKIAAHAGQIALSLTQEKLRRQREER